MVSNHFTKKRIDWRKKIKREGERETGSISSAQPLAESLEIGARHLGLGSGCVSWLER